MSLKKLTNQNHGRTLLVLLVEYPIIGLTLFAIWWFLGWSYLIIGITVVTVLLFISWWGSQPAKNRVNIGQGNFRKYLEALFYRGNDLGFMMVEAPDGKRSMQFTKYVTEQGVTLQFQFPRASWATEYYEPLKNLLTQRDYYYEVHPVRPEDKFPDQTDQFIVVGLDQDLEAAVKLTKIVLLEIFKLDTSDTATVWYANVNVRDEKIGF